MSKVISEEKKKNLIDSYICMAKFLFKTQRNEFGALGGKPLNVVQLISQDNSRHCIMFVWSLTNKTTELVFIFIFLKKRWLNEKLLPCFSGREKRIQVFNLFHELKTVSNMEYSKYIIIGRK